ncbi:MAG: hypothetical protein OFPII_20370 [Osedax symbiont Rs1]|nr:MAG: hypothetical protein OFPII_20370 [Osedax symbiont Rs1]
MLNAEQITELFLLFSKSDPELIQQLRKHSAPAVVNRQWQFTLPELYAFTLVFFQLKEPPSYKKFRSLLFNSTINKDLAVQGLTISILTNHQHVDKSVYFLAKLVV